MTINLTLDDKCYTYYLVENLDTLNQLLEDPEVSHADMMKAVADIPSREVLLGRLFGSMQSPIANFARVIKQIAEKDGEVAEAYDAYHKNKEDLGSELADVAIYLMGLSEILGYDLHDEIVKKREINSKRKSHNFSIVNFTF